MSSRRAAPRLLAGGAGARLAYAVLTRAQPGGTGTWTRTNHRGEPVTLLEGPAVSAAAVAAALAVPGPAGRERAALGLAGAVAAAFGCYDDLAGSSQRHGFRGHLGALAKGEVTTGAVKIAGIGAAGLAASLLLGAQGSRPGAPSGRAGAAVIPAPAGRAAAGRAADVAVNAALVAGSANLLNLFDLRPGRAIKVAVLAAAGLACAGPRARAAVAAPAGAALALLPEDLGERAMLGDCGANAVGAMLGVAAAASLRRPARIAALAAVAGLTAASEKVSFTKVIARTPPLHWLDMLGRRPAQAAAARAPESPGAAPPHAAPADTAATGPSTPEPGAAPAETPAGPPPAP